MAVLTVGVSLPDSAAILSTGEVALSSCGARQVWSVALGVFLLVGVSERRYSVTLYNGRPRVEVDYRVSCGRWRL